VRNERDTWRRGTRVPRLAPGEVHVWRMPLMPDGADAARLAANLSPEEKRRRDTFVDERRRRRWALAQGALRVLLGAYTGEPPGSLRFARGCYGKPMLRSRAAAFSVSHTADLALYAVTRHSKVGIDVERIVPERADGLVADAFVSAAESQHLRACAAELRAREFFRLWTRREAFLKATGTGWSAEASTLDPDTLAGWWLHELPVGPDYSGVVAVEGDACEVRLLHLGLPFQQVTPDPYGESPETGTKHDMCGTSRLQSKRETPIPPIDRLAS